VYGPNLDMDRRLLWDELAGVLSLWNLPCCLGGDFNVTRFPSERLGTARLDHAIMEFSYFISEQGRMDLPLVGGSFTWSISHEPPTWSKGWIAFEGYAEAAAAPLFRIISQFFLIRGRCLGGEGRSNSRICGLKWRGL
jgi:hypothetical protein